ncbi:MAG: thermonuclease family protein [Anaerolineae bacterium]|nr:thermonuclease family protein [Anaerolineae bacterium]
MSTSQWTVIGILGATAMFVLGCLGSCLVGYVLGVVGDNTGRPVEPRVTRTTSLSPTGPPPGCPTEGFYTPTAEPSPTERVQPSPTSMPTATHSPTAISEPTDTATTQPPAPTSTPPWMEARVTHVVDGDTIEVEIEGHMYSLRYIGIECPEPGQYGCDEATQANRQLVEGKTVRLAKDVSDTDQHGRLLRYVYLGDIFVNAELIRSGYATAWTYPPDVAFSDLFVQLESEARGAGRGLWVAPAPTPGPGWDCVGNIYDCGDFSSCDEVMSYWQACPGDPSRLDGDHDGRPCESLCR